MLTTTNLSLKKPEGADIINIDVNIDDLNGNMDILDNAVANKVDKIAGRQLSTEDYTTAEKIKLAGIAEGATNYTHPANHPASIIVQDAGNRFVTDAEKTSWNAKETPAGAQAKADIVQANLSAHMNSAAPHSGHVSHALATAANDFLVASGVGAFVKKTPAEVKTIFGLGSAAYTDSTAYATAEQGAKADAATSKTDFASHLADNEKEIGVDVESYPIIAPESNDTARINRALSYLSSIGRGTLLFTKPAYSFTSLSIPSGVKFKGRGSYNTALNTNATEKAITVYGSVGAPLMEVEIEGITINIPNIGAGNVAIDISTTYHYYFTDVKIVGGNNRYGIGIRVDGSNTGYYGVFSKLKISNFDTGMRLQNSANSSRIMPGSLIYNCNIGAEVIDTNGVSFSGVTFQDFWKKGIYFNDSGSSYTNRNAVIACYFEAHASSSVRECGIDINSTASCTMLVGNLYNNLRSAYPEVRDNGLTTARFEYGGTDYREVLKFSNLATLRSFPDASKPYIGSGYGEYYRGALLYGTADNTTDKLYIALRHSDGTMRYMQIPFTNNGSLDIAGMVLMNGSIQQYSDGDILLGTNTVAAERRMNYDTSFKRIRFHDGVGWRYVNTNISGTTANRPATVGVGFNYFDTTLGKPIWVKSTGPVVWVDAAGTTV